MATKVPVSSPKSLARTTKVSSFAHIKRFVRSPTSVLLKWLTTFQGLENKLKPQPNQTFHLQKPQTKKTTPIPRKAANSRIYRHLLDNSDLPNKKKATKQPISSHSQLCAALQGRTRPTGEEPLSQVNNPKIRHVVTFLIATFETKNLKRPKKTV